MMTNATVSPRFMRIAAWVRSHGVTAICGADLRTGHEFVDITSVQVDREGSASEVTERAYSKADAARILGY